MIHRGYSQTVGRFVSDAIGHRRDNAGAERGRALLLPQSFETLAQLDLSEIRTPKFR